MRPTRRALYVAALGVVFALLPVLVSPRSWTFWPIFLGWLVLTVGIDAVLTPRIGRAIVDCECPATLYIGERDRARVTVRLRGRGATRVELLAELSPTLTPQPRGQATTSGAEFVFEVPLVPLRRGPASLDAVWLRYCGPLGLLQVSRRIGVGEAITVAPNILPVQAVALRFFRDRSFRSGIKIELFKGEGTEFDSCREFLQGEDLRSIDWKCSARHNKLIARQYRAERNHQVMLAVDTGHLMAEPVAGISRLDHALNSALLLSYVGLKSGDRVGLFTFGARPGVFLEPQGGMRAQSALTQVAGQVDYSESETNFTLGLATLMERVRRRSLIIVLTDFVDTVSAELMLENLQRLARRHLVIFVSLRNPELRRISAAVPSDAVRFNSAVVARTLVQDRETVMRRLQRMGILCIDAEPSHVGSELINRYLDIKRRERI